MAPKNILCVLLVGIGVAALPVVVTATVVVNVAHHALFGVGVAGTAMTMIIREAVAPSTPARRVPHGFLERF